MRTIDLFAGCGGLSLGFKRAGFDVVAAFDNWAPAIKVYRCNFKDHEIFHTDLSDEHIDVRIFKKWNPGLIIGGPPCQDFSSAGKRNEDLGRADLTVSYANIIAKVKPKYFVMENVARVETSVALRKARTILHDAGYGLSTTILDASLCGVPQKRKRFFMIGELKGKDDFLGTYLTKNLSTKPTTIRDYLGDSLGLEYYYRHPRSYKRRGVFSVDEPSPTIRGVNRPVPATYKPHAGDNLSSIRTLRPLTTIERSYLQTFPKSFVWKGSKSDLEQLIGNAVPVKLAQYVAKSLKQYLKDKGISLDD